MENLKELAYKYSKIRSTYYLELEKHKKISKRKLENDLQYLRGMEDVIKSINIVNEIEDTIEKLHLNFKLHDYIINLKLTK